MSVVVTAEKREALSAPQRPAPSTAWIWLSSAVGLLGLAAAIVWAVIGVSGYLDRVNELARSEVPGRVTVQIPADGEWFVYLEGARTTTLDQLGIRIADPDGEPVALETYELDLRYDHAGQVGRALATFGAEQPGAYRVEATGTAPAGARLAVGESVARGVVVGVIGILLLLLLTVGGGLALIAVALARRSRVMVVGREVRSRIRARGDAGA